MEDVSDRNSDHLPLDPITHDLDFCDETLVNPYQAPPEPIGPRSESSGASAEFQLSRSQLRHAEAKFLLHAYGGRLTVASLFMIALAILAAFQWPWSGIAGAVSSRLPAPDEGPSLVAKELAVMVSATIVYLGLTFGATVRLRKRLLTQGVADGESISVELGDQSLRWSSSKGSFRLPRDQIRLISTHRGLILPIDRDLFWFVPRSAYFSVPNYKAFVKCLNQSRKQSIGPSLGRKPAGPSQMRNDHPGDPGNDDVVKKDHGGDSDDVSFTPD